MVSEHPEHGRRGGKRNPEIFWRPCVFLRPLRPVPDSTGDTMDDDGDKGEDPQDRAKYDPSGYLRTTFMSKVLKSVIALIAIGAAGASFPHWESADFPVTSLIVYVAGMVFVAMPLCVY